MDSFQRQQGIGDFSATSHWVRRPTENKGHWGRQVRSLGGGALTIRPPTNRPRDISTQTKHPPDKPSAVTIYYCDIRPPIRSVHIFFIHPAFKVDGLSLVTCHLSQNALWHHVHPFLKQNLDGLSQHFGTHSWRPASCLATCGRFVTGFFPIRLRCPAGFSAKCGRFVAIFLDICDVLPPSQQTVNVLSKDLWKKQEISWDSPFKDPLAHMKVSRNWQHFGKNGPFCYVWTKCHSKVGWKIRGQNVTDIGTKYYSETVCHTVTNRLNLLGRNVTILGGRTIRPPWDEMSQ